MAQTLLTLYWFAGALLLPLALLLAAARIALDHDQHRHWPTSGRAVLWCIAAGSIIGVDGGNLAPPSFGVPLFVLYATAWTSKRVLFIAGTATYFLLTALLVIGAASAQPARVRWLFILSWPATLLALRRWRSSGPRAA